MVILIINELNVNYLMNIAFYDIMTEIKKYKILLYLIVKK